jgi:hypothetical protein
VREVVDSLLNFFKEIYKDIPFASYLSTINMLSVMIGIKT